MAERIRIGIVGIGKIARDQHLPALERSPDFTLVAAASRNASVEGAPSFETLPEMLDAHPEIEAVSLCTPPTGRTDLALQALERGKHVMLEKPPAATLGEVELMRSRAEEAGQVLFTTWHSRFAPAVEGARAWLAQRRLKSVRVDWGEDVRRWHPGQTWIWEPGGLGVFDTGINAFSIVSRILPKPIFLAESVLRFPENRAQPVSADLRLQDEDGVPIECRLDWLRPDPPVWSIEAETDGGVLTLSGGGSQLAIDGRPQDAQPEAEYPRLYERFARLVREGRSDVDVGPLRVVADAFLLGRRETTDAFHE